MLTADDYRLTIPSEDGSRSALQRVLGSQEGLRMWNRACEALGFRDPREPLTIPQLKAVADYLSRGGGFVGVMGVSLRIRLSTYETLAGSSAGFGQDHDS